MCNSYEGLAEVSKVLQLHEWRQRTWLLYDLPEYYRQMD